MAHSKASWGLVSWTLLPVKNVLKQVLTNNSFFVFISIGSCSLVSVNLKRVVLISQIFLNWQLGVSDIV